MTTDPRVTAVVLAWNQQAETLECLESLLHSSYSNLFILLVDNGSTDGTDSAVRSHFPSVEVLRLENNVGLERGYNAGIELALRSGADYVMAMNNDTVVDETMISCLVRGFTDHPSAGMVSPKIHHYYGNRKRLWCVGATWKMFPPRVKMLGYNAPDDSAFQHDLDLQYTTSCCMLMSRSALEKAGPFDPAYYFYYDDWDISARFRAAGYEIWYIAAARMWHKVSVSTLKTAKPARWWRVMGEGSVRFYLQYRSRLEFVVFTLYFVLRESAKLNFSNIPAYLSGVAAGWKKSSRRKQAMLTQRNEP